MRFRVRGQGKANLIVDHGFKPKRKWNMGAFDFGASWIFLDICSRVPEAMAKICSLTYWCFRETAGVDPNNVPHVIPIFSF